MEIIQGISFALTVVRSWMRLMESGIARIVECGKYKAACSAFFVYLTFRKGDF